VGRSKAGRKEEEGDPSGHDPSIHTLKLLLTSLQSRSRSRFRLGGGRVTNLWRMRQSENKVDPMCVQQEKMEKYGERDLSLGNWVF
jgi:hypothetical protein